MSATNRGAERQENDDYPTPHWPVHRLLESKKLPSGLWVEPCAGEGSIIKAVNEVRSDVVWLANEYNPVYEVSLREIPNVVGIRIGDAREMTFDGNPSVIVTNPPFNISEALLRHFLMIAPGAMIIFLQRLNWCENRRSDLFRELRPSVYVLPERPSFRDIVTIDPETGKKRTSSTDATAYGWFVFDGLGEFVILKSTPGDIRKLEKAERRRKNLDIKNSSVVEGLIEVESEIATAFEKAAEIEAVEAQIQNSSLIEGEENMGWLPPGMAAEVAKAEAFTRGQIAKDGDYILMHLKSTYQDTKNGPAIIIEHEVVSAAKTVEGIEPNAVGTKVTYFLPNYGEAKVMLRPNLKLYVCGMLGVDPKTVSETQVQETVDALGEGLAAGMYIRGVTFHTEKKNGEDFTGFNWYPVEGQNTLASPDVVKRRTELEKSQGAPRTPPPLQAPPVTQGFAPPLPPPAPMAPPPPVMSPLDGWTANPSNPDYVYRFVNGAAEQKLKAEVLAGR